MWSHKLKVSIEAREMRITIWVAACITVFLLIYGLLEKWDIIESVIFLLPGVATISIGYLIWGKRPKKRSLVIASIISIALVISYSLLLLIILVLFQDFGNMVEPIELIGQESIDVFPEWIIPNLLDEDSIYFSNQSWEEPITFIAYNIDPAHRDSVINDWLEVDHSTIDKIDFSYPSYYWGSLFDNLQQYWSPEKLGMPVAYEYSTDPRTYRKIAIYDSLGTRILLYSWFE